MRTRALRSDNAAGICPEALAALIDANTGHTGSYGEDPWTARATELVRELVEAPDAAVFFLLTGTAANALALAALAPPHGIVGVSPAAHVLTDECGAPGFFNQGLQLRPLAVAHGKIDPRALAPWVSACDVHVGKPAALSLSQATELGTVYSLAELQSLRDAARGLGLKVHVDGARLANAAAALGVTPGGVARAAGADALVVGGTKNGMPGSEALVIFDPSSAEDFEYRRKQAGQLASKHRFLTAPWIGMLESGAWIRHAAHANAMAHALAAGAARLGHTPVHDCQANEVFLALDAKKAGALAAMGWPLYQEEVWQGFRAVCSWDTTEGDVAAFLSDLESCAETGP